jgi:amino acid adenylation domain-containing protein
MASPVETLRSSAPGAPRAGELLTSRIAAFARATPDAVALVFEDRVLTYAEVDRRTSQLAHALRARGVGPEVRVAVSLERGPEAILALLAVMKAGGAYVPLDPAYPADRLAYMLQDSAAALLLTRAEVAAGLPRGDWALLDLDGAAEEIAAMPDTPPAVRVDPASLAYVIYTSGSTGRPKGVMVSHRGMGNLAASQRGLWDVDAASRVLQFASLSFDASVFEMTMAFFAGAALVLARREEMLPGDGFLALLRRHRVTHLTISPSVLAILPHAELPELRVIVVAGEACTPALVDRWAPGRRFCNAYGPTEATVCVTNTRCTPGAPITIGGPLDGMRTYVLDEALRPVARGAAGELFVGGAQLARGYHGRAAVTAERFVPDALGAEPGARLYGTGDLVRETADGSFEYLGRTDHQVKVRGHRIELGEVEAALAAHPDVSTAVVVAFDAADGLRTLCAYYVPRGDVAEAELREALAARLPEWMVPSTWVRMAEMPLSPSGKADRARLPHPESAAHAAAAAGLAPRTETERALAVMWGEVLGMDGVGVDQPFLELGGHSLRGIRVLARISDAFGVDVPPHVLLRSGTIEEIAALVDGARGADRGDAVALVPVGRDERIPLSFSQEATWFFEQFAPGLLAYRAQATMRMSGPLDVPALERALSEIVRRHEIFRTTFPVENGAPYQHIHEPWSVRLPVLEMPGASEAEVRAAAQTEFGFPFDTAALPLVRWALIRLAADEHVLVIVEHHFVHDGWSFGVFMRELRALYLAYAAGQESPLDEPGVQFADFAVWQRRWVQSEAGQNGLGYWERTLAGVPRLALPTDRPRPAAMRFRGAAERIQLDPALAARVGAFSREHGVTLFVTLLTAFQALMSRYSGQTDFALGSGLGNRGNVALEGIIGMVVNTVALRADLAGEPTGLELLARVRETTLSAYEHQDVPFDQVVRRVQPDRTTSALPIYQVAFSFHNAPMPDMDFGGLKLEIEEAQNNGSAKFDLAFVGIPRAEQGAGDEVVMVWEYNTDLFDQATIRRMVGHYTTLLAALVNAPQAPVSRLEMVRDDERARVAAWSGAGAAPAAECVHTRFAAQAARTPAAVAVRHEDATLTYAELDARANRLARHLAAAGVGPETRVGLCMERGVELVVSMLAVLKAGGAYVPLDPAAPAERIAAMVRGSGAARVLTQERLRAALPAGVPALSVDAEWPRIERESAAPFDGGATARTLAYVIHTSGSTGTPKGVGIEHGALANHMEWFNRAFDVTAADRVLQKTPINFDASVWEFYAPLLAGGELVMARHQGERDSRYLARTVRDRGVTLLQLVPSVLRLLLDEPELAGCASLRTLFCGGEALPGELCGRASAVLPAARIVNLYGPAECCIDTSTHTVAAGDRDRAVVSIGRPVPGTRSHVVDAAGRTCPVGVPGELCIGGAQVGRGYLGRPALTAAAFVPDPFAAEPGARMYRTGDRARWLADGTLEYLGRMDDQVKIRGIRIEPGEIEAVMRRHPAVGDCVVVAREDAPGDRRLVGYFTGAAEPEALRAHLRALLPENLVPSALVAMDALPLSPNGKLDRRALPAPEYTAASSAEWVEPATEAEIGIAALWAELLGAARVSAADDFFALGGDSLLATRVVVRTRELLGRDVAVVSLFNHRTLADFAAVASQAPATEGVAADDDMLAGFEDDDEFAFAGAGWDDITLG